MTALPGPFYLFKTPEQKKRLHQAGLAETIGVDPAAGAAVGPISGCRIDLIAPSGDGDLFWVDRRGMLFAGRGETPFPGTEGPKVGKTARLIVGKERLWLLAAPRKGESCRRLVQLDRATLHPLIDPEVEDLADIASDGGDGLWLLAGGRLRRMSGRGAETGSLPPPGEPASRIAAAGGRLALLSKDRTRLAIREPESRQAMSLDLPGACVALSGSGDSFLVRWGVAQPGAPRFLVIDIGGNRLVEGSWRDDRAPALLAMTGADLIALFRDDGRQALKRFRRLARPGAARQLTPALETESPSGSWLRAQAVVTLPEGATLAMRWAATADESLKQTVDAVLADQSRPKSARLKRLDTLLTWSDTFTYVGARRDPAEPDPVPERFALPLHQAKGPILWVDLQLRSNDPAAPEPAVESLVVFHEAQSLMDDLPAIYRGDGDRDRTLRRLVGVLEATTQDIDQRIGRLADRLDPKRTGAQWLPDLAAMLGLPFHDALSPEMQRNLVRAAAPILAKRGTRDGLLALLGALFRGRPVRVIDRTDQLVPLSLGRGGAGGRALPALLAGPSIRSPRLNARLVLKKTALCRTNACADPLLAAPPQVLVAVPATWSERRRYGEAVTHMIEAMIPAGVRLRLSWRPWGGAATAAPDDVLTVLDAPETLKLGAGPGLGRAYASGRRPAWLDAAPRPGLGETKMRRTS